MLDRAFGAWPRVHGESATREASRRHRIIAAMLMVHRERDPCLASV